MAELQRQLNDLGFDAGKVDGVFGPETQRALRDFQHNRSIAEDGITGPQVLGELRLVSRDTRKGRAERPIREREWLRSLPRTLAGSRVYFDAGCRTDEERDRAWDAANGAAIALQGRGGVPLMSRSADTNMPERVRARRANRLGAEMIVSFQLPVEEPGVFFFASSMSRSEAGALLAAEMAAHSRPHGRWTVASADSQGDPGAGGGDRHGRPHAPPLARKRWQPWLRSSSGRPPPPRPSTGQPSSLR